MVVGLRLRRRQHDAAPTSPTTWLQPVRTRSAASRRRQRPGVRLAVRDAHLARSATSCSLRPDAARRDGRAIRRRTRRSPPAASAARPRAEGQQLNATITAQIAAADARAVRAHHPARRRPTAARSGSATSRASSSAPRTTSIVGFYNGKPAAGIGDPARLGRQRARHRRAGQGASSTSSPQCLPARREATSSPSTPRPSCRSRSRRSSRR